MSEPSQSSSGQRLPLSAKMIARRIHLIRDHRVMLDSDLADLYGVSTAALNQQVKRNRSRFPKDFAFRLTPEEFDGLMSQIVISKPRRGGRRKLPWVFSEHGVAMLSSVLRSERAVQVNIAIMRTFVRLREMLSGHKELLIRLDSIERNLTQHDKHFKVVFDAIRKLMEPPSGPLKRRIGFHVEKD
jgi:hypothetical protein